MVVTTGIRTPPLLTDDFDRPFQTVHRMNPIFPKPQRASTGLTGGLVNGEDDLTEFNIYGPG
jgi:hypothetical protein